MFAGIEQKDESYLKSGDDARSGMDSDEEYSASISAVLQKRQLSAKKLSGKRRRGSATSPTPGDDGQLSSDGSHRRHSSVFTLSEW
jgi:hypothetical protein